MRIILRASRRNVDYVRIRGTGDWKKRRCGSRRKKERVMKKTRK